MVLKAICLILRDCKRCEIGCKLFTNYMYEIACGLLEAINMGVDHGGDRGDKSPPKFGAGGR